MKRKTSTKRRQTGMPGRVQYSKRIPLTTESGICEAEKFHEDGWKVCFCSPWSIQFYLSEEDNDI